MRIGNDRFPDDLFEVAVDDGHYILVESAVYRFLKHPVAVGSLKIDIKSGQHAGEAHNCFSLAAKLIVEHELNDAVKSGIGGILLIVDRVKRIPNFFFDIFGDIADYDPEFRRQEASDHTPVEAVVNDIDESGYTCGKVLNDDVYHIDIAQVSGGTPCGGYERTVALEDGEVADSEAAVEPVARKVIDGGERRVYRTQVYVADDGDINIDVLILKHDIDLIEQERSLLIGGQGDLVDRIVVGLQVGVEIRIVQRRRTDG